MPADLRGSAVINARIDRLPGWGLPKAAFAILGIAYFVDIYDVSIVGYSLPVLKEHFHLTATQVTVMLTGNLVATALGAILFGFLGDILGRQRSFFLGLGALTVTALLTAVAWDTPSLLVFRVLSGFATGGGIAVVTALVQEFSPAERRGKYLAYNVFWSGVAAVAAAFLSTALVPVENVGWRILFGVGAVALVLMFFTREPIIPESPRWLATRGRLDEADRITTALERRMTAAGHALPAVPDVPPDTASERFPLRLLFRPPYLQRLLVVIGFWFGVQWSVRATITFQPTILTEFGLSLSSGTMLLAIGTLAGVATYCVMPFVIDRVERKKLIVLGLALATLSPLLVTVTSGHPAAVVLGSVLTQVAGPILFVPGFSYAAEVFPTHARASGGSLAGGLGQTGGVLQSVVLVAVAAAGPHVSMLVLAAGYVFAALIIFYLAIPTTGRSLTAISGGRDSAEQVRA
ncbi:MFS transporter [Amycolatopsis methanolica]|uniref:4-hydroxybenzoate transporter n=1 Tax=Amycolatopsis methanolica 239 TaxID=1068978 RepID=A0A076N4P2_AMYME|nr:MFS transporter [Amycolatopsis methanolica]AIJ25770.1 4-hydroxybenzoate transporter [Amycolatopsis methanolica 239]